MRLRGAAGRLARAAGWLAALGLVFLPLAVLLYRSVRPGDGFSLESYRGLWTAGALASFTTSAALASAAALVSTCLGTGMALLLETRRVPFRRALRLLALAPLLIPPYMQVAAWRPLLLGPALPGEWERALAAALVLGFSYAPLVFYFASQGIRGISGEVLETARLSPVSEWTVAARIIIPLAGPAIAAGAAVVLALSFLDHETPALFEVRSTFAMRVFLEVPRGAGQAFAWATPAIALLLLAAAGTHRWAERRGFAVTWSENPGAPHPSRPAGLRALAALAVLGGLLVGFPLVRLWCMAGSIRRLGEALALHGEAFLWGIPLTLGAAAAAAALAALLVDRTGRLHPGVALLAWVPLAVPGTVLALALIEVYNRPFLEAIYGSRWILVIAGAARFFPVAVHALAAHLRAVPPDLWDADRLSPQPLRFRLVRVYLPLASPGLALAAAAVVVLLNGELAATNLIAPPGHQPPPITIASALHYNVDLEVPAALCLLQVAAGLLALGLIAALERLARGSSVRGAVAPGVAK